MGVPAIRVESVAIAGEFSLRLRWTNGMEFTVDLRNIVSRHKLMKALQDPKLFARVALGEGGHSIEWPGDLDMGARSLLQMALEQNGH